LSVRRPEFLREPGHVLPIPVQTGDTPAALLDSFNLVGREHFFVLVNPFVVSKGFRRKDVIVMRPSRAPVMSTI
jgi:hypothetical protein